MFTIGNIEEFAISYQLEKDHGGVSLFGNLCYWIGGEKIGDYELTTSLYDVIMPLRSIVIDNGNRENINLFNLDYEELYARLDKTLYGGGEKSDYEELSEIECWARFIIHPSVDIFNEYKIYLIDSPPQSRILYSYCQQNVVEFNIASGKFDQVVASFFNTLFDIYELELDT